MSNRILTLGSLFDGSGSFPLGGLLAGITPVWASEIEPFPIRVTTKRLPFVKHYGDISQMDGGKIEPVDIITFGSPCTDMSISGRRAGLEGRQSVLFYQAIRIIREIRCATDGKYPRYICWENVPGAFSSNAGRDFKSVLEAVIGIVEPQAEVPPAGKNGWPYADVYLGDGWSVAYRTLDACGWGVPQRRRRIYLVADFAGGGAGDVLFKSEGLSGYSAAGFRAWQRAARGSSAGAGTPGICLNDQGGARMTVTDGVSATLRAEEHGHPPCVMETAGFSDHATKVYGICSAQSHAMLSANPHSGFYEAATTRTLDANGGNPGCAQGGMAIVENAAYGIDRAAFNQGQNARYSFSVDEEVEPTMVAKGPGAVAVPVYSTSHSSYHTSASEEVADALIATDYKDPPLINEALPEYTVRRLTPTECARLQGFPDWWCSDLETPEPTEDELRYWHEVFETHRKAVGRSSKPKTMNQIAKWLCDPHTDAAEYKMWGNGCCLPIVFFVLAGIAWAANKEDSADHPPSRIREGTSFP